MKNQFNGKAIYNPKGKAAEYARWACNFYIGCSNGCEYCYLKKGIGAKTLGGNVPTLKKCFENEDHALGIFEKELIMNKEELQEHGLFFSFTTDPLLKETRSLTFDSIATCMYHWVPVKILTKCTEWINHFDFDYFKACENEIAFGFTLTGHDELEPGASTNQERIEEMKKLHGTGFKTFASIEPIIDLISSMEMIEESIGACDLYKIGLMSGIKPDKDLLSLFIKRVCILGKKNGFKVYWKDSITKYYGPIISECSVDRDYNIFHEPVTEKLITHLS